MVYFQDLNQVTTVGASAASTDTFANYLRAPVERGELALLGESTPAALAVGLDSAPSFRRSFIEARMIEPTLAQALVIAKSALSAKPEDAHPDDDAVVRVYYLDGQQEVRDVRANVRTSRLDLVLSGDLSELFTRDG